MKKGKPARRWKILVTGTPGTGKSFLARELGNQTHARVIAEKTIASRAGIGVWAPSHREYEVDLSKLGRALRAELRHEKKKSVIVEGHLSCEISLPVDGVIVLTCPLPRLETRLRERGYSEVKIQDNLFCEDQRYCENQVRSRYRGIPVRVISTHRPKKVIRATIAHWIQRKIVGGPSSESKHSRSRRRARAPRSRGAGS